MFIWVYINTSYRLWAIARCGQKEWRDIASHRSHHAKYAMGYRMQRGRWSEGESGVQNQTYKFVLLCAKHLFYNHARFVINLGKKWFRTNIFNKKIISRFVQWRFDVFHIFYGFWNDLYHDADTSNIFINVWLKKSARVNIYEGNSFIYLYSWGIPPHSRHTPM